jgi:hypothetical protein
MEPELRPLGDRMAGAMSKPRRLRPPGQKRPRLSLAGYQRPVPSRPARLEARERTVPVNPPPIEVPPVEQLRSTAMRLTAEFDQARLHQAAAHVSKAVEAMARAPEPAVNDNVFRSDVECQFELDEYERV